MEGSIRADQSIESFANVSIEDVAGGKRATGDRGGNQDQKRLVAPQELLLHLYVEVWVFSLVHLRQAFTLPRLLEIIAFEWTVDSHFAFCAAADGTDIAARPRAVAARASCMADLAGAIAFRHAAIMAGAAGLVIMIVMVRTDIYIKVVIDHEDDERMDRLASEICRQVEKVYGVRKAELSNYVSRPRED
jgi:hypothetical protein